jgi:NhaA family Na+:H+ antiporter
MRAVRAEGSPLNRQVLLPAERFIYSETISDALLLVCAIAALVWANSPWSQSYFALRDTPVSLQIGAFSLALDLQHWINDGLMAIFFFVVALEMKRELLRGDRSDARKAALPVAAALGGMILPAGIFFAVNSGGAGAPGWGIPTATDIAFAVAILALLGKRAPSSLQLFLLTFAIADDVGSILVIAIYYTAHFSPSAMAVAGAVLGLMLAMRWLGFRSPLAYLLPAVLFWVAMLKSGVHATIAGVILGAITPAKSLGRTSTFVETVWDLLPDMRDALDGEESDATDHPRTHRRAGPPDGIAAGTPGGHGSSVDELCGAAPLRPRECRRGAFRGVCPADVYQCGDAGSDGGFARRQSGGRDRFCMVGCATWLGGAAG